MTSRSPPPVRRHVELEPSPAQASALTPSTPALTIDAVSTHEIQRWMSQIEQCLNDICTISGDGKLNTEQKLKISNISRQEFAEVRSEFSDKLESVSKTLNDQLGEFTKTIEAKNLEIAFLKTSVTNLQRQLAVHEQNSIKNELEIVGLPEYDNENLMQITSIMCKKIGVDLNEQDVDEVIRVGPRNLHSSDSSQRKWPRPVVVKLLRRRTRDEILKAAKSRRNVTSEHVVEGPPKNVYFNERLTKENRTLFREARQWCQRVLSFKFCWIRNGAVHIRQSENRAAVRLQSIEELDQKIGHEPDG
ncbi:uncharacterized protein LOC113238417 [Hyposmocoma kahamanoa]|uniref:uncharacterized protein LOC113238417 n=1 Tax=Hyposmocoma kahamanoa TaxID=1477025 RepID=UPI000E6D89E2|nr:uncharacterized protein LOC113238417 [Hyposmocoma kahamanoa]